MDDLILSVVKNRLWCDLDVYALSVAKSGFIGRKVMFVEDVPQDAINNLLALGFEVYAFTTPEKWRHLHFQSYRYYVAKDFLADHWKEFRFVLWTDVCDLVLQSDPIPHLYFKLLVAAKEGRKMNAGGGQGWNEIWVRKFLSKAEADALMDEEVLCSGSIGGDSSIMRNLLGEIWDYCSRYGEMRGIDQGIFNYLARTPSYREDIRVPEMSEGFVSTCGMFMSEYNTHEWTVDPPYLDRESGLVYTSPSGKPFAIAHCYDRNGGALNSKGDFRAILERRYRS
jgi:hypothetical protein